MLQVYFYFKKIFLFHRLESIMSKGMFKMMIGLVISKDIIIPKGEMLRYNKRFMLFSTLNDMVYYDYDRYLEYSRFFLIILKVRLHLVERTFSY
jgi:hypothetical protein